MNQAVPLTLTPRPWTPGQDPSPWLAEALAQADPAPLLLLLERRLSGDGALVEQLRAWLTAAERQRLAALLRPVDRERFLLGRAGLRRLLAALRGEDPARVPIRSTAHGKPFCPGGPGFNASHGGDLIVLALHPSRPVGVDLQRLRPGRPWRPVAERMLTAGELRRLEALPAERQAEAFTQAWCRLEARVKAHGCGLARRRELPPEATAAEQVWAVALPADYRGAVVCLARSLTSP